MVLPGAGGDDFTPGGGLEAYATCDFVLVSGRHRLLSSAAVLCWGGVGYWREMGRWESE